MPSKWTGLKFFRVVKGQPTKATDLFNHSTNTKLKEFADDNFKFDEYDRKFSERVGNTLGKEKKCWLGTISPFSTVFSKDLYRRHVKTRACLGKG